MRVYLDNAAATQVDPRVLKTMMPYFSKNFGNASSLYELGREANEALEKSRKTIANVINAEPGEIIFTSGGTESDNLAIKGVLSNKKHLITSTIEHPAVLNVFKQLKNKGYKITILPVNKQGIVNLEKLKKSITKQTGLVSIMHANNEIGTIQPIREIGNICKKKGVLFHTDAVQTFGKIPIDVKKMNIDLLSISSHKIYGPKGVGALYVRKGVKINPIIQGGGHEDGIRSGTENVAGIVGFAKAAELCKKEMNKEFKRQIKLRDHLIKNILKIENSWLNGHSKKRLANNAHFCFRFIEGEALVLKLDDKGIAASTGSACSSKHLEASHILLAIGLSPRDAHGSLRVTMGRFTKKSDIDYVINILPKVVNNLRKISPFKGRW
jgi:cysteine desulfurase